MQMVKKIIGMLIASWLLLLIFMPKEEMYYSVEKILATRDITLNEKSIDEGLFSLTLKDVTIYVKGIALVNVKKIDFFTLLFYNTLKIDNILVDEVLQSRVPSKTKEVAFSYQIFNPLNISVDANGSFGHAIGSIDLSDKKVHIDFVKTKNIEVIKSLLKKGKKGWFYEKSF